MGKPGYFLATIGVLVQTLCVHAQPMPTDTDQPLGTSPSELGLEALTDDSSRQQLFKDVIEASAKEDLAEITAGTQYFNLYGPFRFPNDTTFDVALKQPRTNAIFGIDISHWTDKTFPVEQLANRNVAFLYMKATQGQRVDDSFASFWARAGKLPDGHKIHRGAYHFLTCGDAAVGPADWGKKQADAFLKVIKASGGLLPTDMPPTLDLEWDRTAAVHDRWTCRAPADIVSMVKAFQERVKAEIHRTPMIYTARAWWRERMGSETLFAELSSYPIWIADYSKTSRASEVPPQINKTAWALWQFTDAATMAIGFNRGFDANVFKGTKEEFHQAFDVVALP